MKYKELQISDFDKLNTTEMSDSQFSIMSHHAKNKDFSRFANFCTILKGLDLYYKKSKIDKWEAFYLGRNAERILTNKSDVKAVKR